MTKIAFTLHNDRYAVVRRPAGEDWPAWALQAPGLCSLTRTLDEVSVVCLESVVPAGEQAERGWCGLQLQGPFAFDQVGILSSFIAPLAAAGIGIFAISTFDTDLVLIKSAQLPAALRALSEAGHIQLQPSADLA